MTQYFQAEYAMYLSGVAPRQLTTITINTTQYEFGKMLGEGGFGSVYAGRRLCDGLQVALKTVLKKDVEYINFTDHPEPFPLEVALQMLANRGPRVPEILQLLEWEDYQWNYIMVLERFSPCMDVLEYRTSNGGRISEKIAKVIMRAATKAAYECFDRGVFHRDIKMENLLINPDTLEVKLIDFGCGDFFQTSPYTTFWGTRTYCCPEYLETGEYYAEPATVYSLGVLLFAMVYGEFPKPYDHWIINSGGAFYTAGLSEDCCSLIQACMLQDQAQRIRLEEILVHDWLNAKKCRMPCPPECSESAEIVENPLINTELECSNEKEQDETALRQSATIATINTTQYEVGEMLGEGGFGSVFAATRLDDGLQVALKTVLKKDVEYINFTDHPEPFPLEVALQMLANRGPRVPEILQLLEWEDYQWNYIMVLERFSPCMDVLEYRTSNGGRISEKIAKVIMRAATKAAYECLDRGVFHRDIKMENLLINPDTLEVKLIDFGCGEFFQTSPYTAFWGTRTYCCPEYLETGEYYAEPATVYSLGVLLFAMVYGKFPKPYDHWMINSGGAFYTAGLSEDCCSLIQACMLEDPEERICLNEILVHKWLNDKKDRIPQLPEYSERVEDVENTVDTEMELTSNSEKSSVISYEMDLANDTEDNKDDTEPELASNTEENPVINKELDVATEQKLDVATAEKLARLLKRNWTCLLKRNWTWLLKRNWTWLLKRNWTWLLKRSWTWLLKRSWKWQLKRSWTWPLKRSWTWPLKRSWTWPLKRSWKWLLKRNWAWLLKRSWTWPLKRSWTWLLKRNCTWLLKRNWMWLLKRNWMWPLKRSWTWPQQRSLTWLLKRSWTWLLKRSWTWLLKRNWTWLLKRNWTWLLKRNWTWPLKRSWTWPLKRSWK